MTAADITPRQRDFLRALNAYVELHGMSPSVRELGEDLGGIGVQAVADLVDGLKRRGLLKSRPYTARSMQLTPAGRRLTKAMEPKTERARADELWETANMVTCFLGCLVDGMSLDMDEARAIWERARDTVHKTAMGP